MARRVATAESTDVVDRRTAERRARQIELRLGAAIPEGSVLRTRLDKVRAAAKRTEDAHQRLDLLVDAARELRDELPGGVGRSCLPDHLLNSTQNGGSE